MSDEEKLRGYVKPSPWATDIVEGILSDRDSLRAALERIAAAENLDPNHRAAELRSIARQALTSSEKETDPGPIGTKPLLSKVDGNAIREALDSNREGT